MYAYPVEVVLAMVFCKYNEHSTTSVEQNRLTGTKDNCSMFQQHHTAPLYSHRTKHSTHTHTHALQTRSNTENNTKTNTTNNTTNNICRLLCNYKNAGNDNYKMINKLCCHIASHFDSYG